MCDNGFQERRELIGQIGNGSIYRNRNCYEITILEKDYKYLCHVRAGVHNQVGILPLGGMKGLQGGGWKAPKKLC